MKHLKRLYWHIYELFTGLTLYKYVKTFDFFNIKGELGNANLMKCSDMNICLKSENGSYEKGVNYKVLDNQKVKITSR